MNNIELSEILEGKTISGIEKDNGFFRLIFTDGSTLTIRANVYGLFSVNYSKY